MNRSDVTCFVLFVASITFCLIVPLKSHGQDRGLTTFSGLTVDEVGNPIEGLAIGLVSVFDGNGAWFPTVDGPDWPDDPTAFRTETDSEGRFVITDAIAGPVLLVLLPYYKPETVILKVQIGDTFHYSNEEPWGRGIVFSIEQGEYIDNVEVTARHFLEFRGKVLKMDRSPLRNARIRFKVEQLGLDQKYEDKSSNSWGIETDAAGNFVQHINRYTCGPAFYFLSVTYQETRINLDPVVMQPADLTHEAVFTFENSLMPDLPGDAPRRFHAGASASVGGGLDAKNAWIINPANGHAYKKIPFRSMEVAISEAVASDAYLVTINSEAEQRWLERVFVPMWTLIGLNDVEKEDTWQWQNGEPVTYTNWARYEPHDTDKGDADYVILMGGQWIDIGPEDIRWRFVRAVILEKDEMPIKK